MLLEQIYKDPHCELSWNRCNITLANVIAACILRRNRSTSRANDRWPGKQNHIGIYNSNQHVKRTRFNWETITAYVDLFRFICSFQIDEPGIRLGKWSPIIFQLFEENFVSANYKVVQILFLFQPVKPEIICQETVHTTVRNVCQKVKSPKYCVNLFPSVDITDSLILSDFTDFHLFFLIFFFIICIINFSYRVMSFLKYYSFQIKVTYLKE